MPAESTCAIEEHTVSRAVCSVDTLVASLPTRTSFLLPFDWRRGIPEAALPNYCANGSLPGHRSRDVAVRVGQATQHYWQGQLHARAPEEGPDAAMWGANVPPDHREAVLGGVN